ncbi:hypothetical protein CEXT_554321 [Caerostris extrusa]|uniref:Secreted protein n=1 Tax=Caerostris extrusa TaxID=172846 RepID=A0AAV4RPZ9_CAEEX|nr:hypothetical protein CEXT_554321 [Caerostris extrusa]
MMMNSVIVAVIFLTLTSFDESCGSGLNGAENNRFFCSLIPRNSLNRHLQYRKIIKSSPTVQPEVAVMRLSLRHSYGGLTVHGFSVSIEKCVE